VADESDESDEWEGYSSAFMFPSEDEPCTCEHLPHEHDYSSCAIDNCTCQAYWEHT
jgi:hypothetical protein